VAHGTAHRKVATRQTTRRDFWRHPVDQDNFARELTVALILAGICRETAAPAVADKLFEIIRASRGWIARADA
jgi:hypothetical protein